MSSNPLDSYKEVERATLSGRDLEAHALNKAASILQGLRNNWHGDDLEGRVEAAVRYNQRLWTLFQSELMEPTNPLGADIKTNLLTLSLFVDKRTFEILAFPAPEKLDILISINRNIAAGLSTGPGMSAAAAAGD